MPGESIVKQFIKYLTGLFLAAMVVSVMGCASSSKQQGTGEYIDDAVITSKVKAAIFNESSIKSNEINVETYKGVVQLSGFVNSQNNIDKSVEVSRGVKGVKSVKNALILK
ncbi:MAG: BON domain-containing protein [Oxalobacter sp.]|nr:MAG: BON domain-containing protein [Oxalobacter sp.]